MVITADRLFSGFGVPFLLVPVLWLILLFTKKEIAFLTFMYGVGSLGVFLFNFSLNVNWSFFENERFYPVVITLTYFLPLCLYTGFVTASLSAYKHSNNICEDGKRFWYTNFPICEFGGSFICVLIAGMIALEVVILTRGYNLTPTRVNYVFVVGVVCLYVVFLIDRMDKGKIAEYFKPDVVITGNFARKIPLLIVIGLVLLGTFFEISRGLWFIWITHVIFLLIVYLIHKRYWGSVYK